MYKDSNYTVIILNDSSTSLCKILSEMRCSFQKRNQRQLISGLPSFHPWHLSARWVQLAQMRPEVEEVVPRSVHGSTGTTGDHLTEKSVGSLALG